MGVEPTASRVRFLYIARSYATPASQPQALRAPEVSLTAAFGACFSSYTDKNTDKTWETTPGQTDDAAFCCKIDSCNAAIHRAQQKEVFLYGGPSKGIFLSTDLPYGQVGVTTKPTDTGNSYKNRVQYRNTRPTIHTKSPQSMRFAFNERCSQAGTLKSYGK